MTIQVTSPGVYPLETRECPGCVHCTTESARCTPIGCNGLGRVPDENGPQVEIQYDAVGNSYLEGPGYYWCTELEYSGPFPTPAKAFADAQRAHEESE